MIDANTGRVINAASAKVQNGTSAIESTTDANGSVEVKGTKWGNIGDGWVSMSYIVLDGQSAQTSTVKTVKADCLRVRQSASTGAKIVGYYYQGEKVTILETKKVNGTTWGKTNKGWISMDYVK